MNLVKVDIYRNIHTHMVQNNLRTDRFISCKNTLMFYILFYILGLLYFPVILVIAIYHTTNES